MSRTDTERALGQAATTAGYGGTFMVMRWNMYAVGFPAYDVEESGDRFLSWNGVRPRTPAEALSFFERNLASLVRSIGEARTPNRIGLLLQVPQMPFFPQKEALVDFHRLRFRALPLKPAALHFEESARLRAVLARATAGIDGVDIVDPGPLLCQGEHCAYRHEWSVVYKDDDHLSVYGETLLVPLFRNWLDQIQVPSRTRPAASEDSMAGRK